MRVRDLDLIDNYRAAMKALKGKSKVRIAHNTWLQFDSFADAVEVIYHDTVIVKYFKYGDIRLDTGGWVTATTAMRMHAMTPATVRINRKKGDMILTVRDRVEVIDSPTYILESEM